MSFSRSGTPAPPFSYPVGTGVFTDVLASNTVFSNYFRGDGGFLSNITGGGGGGFTQPLANLVVSNSVTTTNVFVTRVNLIDDPVEYVGIFDATGDLALEADGTMHVRGRGLQSWGYGLVADTLGNLYLGIGPDGGGPAQGLKTQGGDVVIDTVRNANFANLTVSNTVTTTNVIAAGFTSNSTNTVFNYTTLSAPYMNCTSLNVTGTATYSTLTATNSLATGSIGFATIAGTGGSNTQITSRNTGVTINKPCGTITLFSSAILSQASNTFTLTNSYITSTDFVLVNHVTGQTPGAYTIATDPNAGGVNITMRNVSGGTLTAGAPILQFVVIKSTNS